MASKPARSGPLGPVDSSSGLDLRLARRSFLRRGSLSLGALAFASLEARRLEAVGGVPAGSPSSSGLGALDAYHFRPRAKRVIFLCMAGGPSHLETFDPKPELERLHGQPMPASLTRGQPIAQLQGQRLFCQRPMFEFERHGASGQLVSTVIPHIATLADKICIVRSMQTDQINHDPAHTVMNTGTSISGRPSMGSWITYGLGSDADDLPGFVVLVSVGGRNPQPIATRHWHSGFLPGVYQGVKLETQGDPVHYIGSPPGVDRARQRDVVRAIRSLDEMRFDRTGDTETATRIRQYELAFRMQASVPELVDLSGEPPEVLEMYGTNGSDGSFAANCLLARRLAERGVRFIQLYHRGWDHHNDLVPFMKVCSRHVDRATAALVRDLDQRGMLEDTLIVWGGEFGRTPMAQTNKGGVGRDHHIRAFSMWLAGGGIRGGITHGATDELGYNAVEDKVHVHDLHATMLYLLGIDHEKLTYRHQGRDFRLTDVAGRVVHEIVA